MNEATTKLSTQVPVKRLRRAEKILDKLGLTPADAVNMLLAQIEMRRGLPFEVNTRPSLLLSADEQAAAWTGGVRCLLNLNREKSGSPTGNGREEPPGSCPRLSSAF